MVVIATQLGVGIILRQHRERKQVTARPINPAIANFAIATLTVINLTILNLYLMSARAWSRFLVTAATSMPSRSPASARVQASAASLYRFAAK